MNIKVKLEMQLDKVEQELLRLSSDEEVAMLRIAKATILTALQNMRSKKEE